MKDAILVVDDEAGVRSSLAGILGDEGYAVTAADSGEAGLAALEARRFDLVLLDVWLPGLDGLEVLRRIRERDSELPVVVISGHGTIETAVKAVRLGAQDFVEKPLSLEKTVLAVRNALRQRRLESQLRELRQQLDARYAMVGESPALQRLREEIRQAAPSNGRVLIFGENGTGKELVARAIHAQSQRAAGPFVEVNCAAIPEELIESELFGHTQGRLHRRPRDPQGQVRAGRRRHAVPRRDRRHEPQDAGEGAARAAGAARRARRRLGQRRRGRARDRGHQQGPRGRDPHGPLPRGPLLPPERDPVPGAAAARAGARTSRCSSRHFMQVLSAEHGRKAREVVPDALEALARLPWPGNVRELRNILERLVIMTPGERIELQHLPATLAASLPARAPAADESSPAASGDGTLLAAREAFERRYILERYRECGGNMSRTAESLGVERSNLYRKMKAFGLLPARRDQADGAFEA